MFSIRDMTLLRSLILEMRAALNIPLLRRYTIRLFNQSLKIVVARRQIIKLALIAVSNDINGTTRHPISRENHDASNNDRQIL